METSRKIPDRIVGSRKPSPVAKSGLSSTFIDTTPEEHAKDLKKFISVMK
jgi:hypothetical protein